MSQQPETRWWAGINRQTVGPWTVAEFADAVRSGGIGPQTLVCPVGGQAWLPLNQIRELATLIAPPPQPATPIPYATPVATTPYPQPAQPNVTPPNPYAVSQEFQIDTRSPVRSWPTMATLVGNYCLYLMPIYQVIFLLDLLINGTGVDPESPMYWSLLLDLVIDIPIRLLLIGLFIVAGIKWQSKDRSAIVFTYAALIIGFVKIAFTLLIIAIDLPILLNLPDDGGPAEPFKPLEKLMFFTAFVTFAWEIGVLIWMLMYAKTLPWLSQTERVQ